MKSKRRFMAGRAAIVTISLVAGGLACAAGMPTGPRYTNSIGMEFVRIEPGSFIMGSRTGGDWDERPVHKVNITRPFYMGVTEVTNAQYEQFDKQHKFLRGRRGISKAFNEPVVYVSWHDAVAFCRWLSKKEGLPYRLPTEAEWEYACRAGTDTAYCTGDELPQIYHKQQGMHGFPEPVDLTVGTTPANQWGLYDMHGNVEEWCLDWYGPYLPAEQTDPVGYIDGDFRVSRGGSHNTELRYLRSANRQGTLPEDKHWLIGFRVVIGKRPSTAPLRRRTVERWASTVRQDKYHWPVEQYRNTPYFRGPENFVKIPEGSNGPLFSRHNHQPAITACPNGDLLAIWYSTTSEKNRKLTVAASRLRRGSSRWEPAAPFWDAPDRNDHGSSLLWDERTDTLYHFNGLSAAATWANLALIMRTSKDNGATWSKARIIQPTHEYHHQVIAGSFITREGYIIVPCDAVPGGSGGSAIHISKDGGKTWLDPGYGRPQPKFEAGGTGAWIAGIHTGCAQLADGSLLAFGRGDEINGRMPKSISKDMGINWTYSASDFQGIGGGRRLVLERLVEGPLFLASFGENMEMVDATGRTFQANGLYAAVSYDEGRTWPLRKLITDGKPAHKAYTSDGDEYTMSPTNAEPHGYLACTVTPDGVIHLISSWNYYAFNLAWLKEPMPAVSKPH